MNKLNEEQLVLQLQKMISVYLPALAEYAIDYSGELDQYWIIVWPASLEFYPLQYIVHQLRKIVLIHRVNIVDVELDLAVDRD